MKSKAKVSVNEIQKAILDYSGAGNENILSIAVRRGYVRQISHTQYEWVDEEALRRCKENENSVDDLPSRVKYYLLEYKDNNLDKFVEEYGTGSLRNLSQKEILEFFVDATNSDASKLIQKTAGDAKEKAQN